MVDKFAHHCGLWSRGRNGNGMERKTLNWWKKENDGEMISQEVQNHIDIRISVSDIDSSSKDYEKIK